MISRLEHTSDETAQRIRAVFQVSYAVEAKLLKAKNFPPLQRKLNEFLESDTFFYGYFKEDSLTAVIEIDIREDATHIQSLGVAPTYFRQGIASALLDFVLEKYPLKLITVETGLDNEPATQLYQGFGFKKTKEWDTNHGVRKIAFELIRRTRNS